MKDKQLEERSPTEYGKLVKEALRLVRWIVGFAIFCYVLSTWGCASKERIVTEYKTVKVPVKCAARTPPRPEPTGNPVETNLLILKYAEELEAALRSCK